MTNVVDFKQEKFSTEEITKALRALNVENQVDQEAIKLMQYGEPSPILKNIQLQDGTVKDGKLKLVPDGNNVRVSFQFKKPNLEIPQKIFGHQLSKEEIAHLKEGITIPIPKTDYFIKIDKDLNAVTVQTGKEIGVPKELGGYQLTPEDKLELANTGSLSARVFKVPGREEYFTGNLKINQDGITISNINVVSKEQAAELMQDLNNPKARTMANVVETIKDAVVQAEKEAEPGKAVSASSEVMKGAMDNGNEELARSVEQQAEQGLIPDGQAHDSIMAISSKAALSTELDKAIKSNNIQRIAYIGQHQLGDGINFDKKVEEGLDKEGVKAVYMKMNDLETGKDKSVSSSPLTKEPAKSKDIDLSI